MKRLINEKRHQYLSLIKEIAVTNFKLKYQGSILGYLWSLLKPLSYFTILYIIFTKVFKVGGSVEHYPIYLLLGVLIFSYWGEATSSAMTAIVSKGDLIRKVSFPRIILVISSTITATITFLLNMLVVIVFAFFNNISFNISMALVLLYFVELYIFILGISFYLSSLYVKFRDTSHIWEVINQILFYATPILYVITQAPDRYARIMVLSPLAQIILDVRNSIIGSSIITAGDYWIFPYIPHLVVVIIFFTGYILFNKMAVKFAEEV